jgi:tRNA pseudouridine38-40 synthase
MRLLAWIQYSGLGYSGWQKQRGERTVQAVIQKAISDLYGRKIRVLGSSRTDAGAHAVCHPAVFDVEEKYQPAEIMRAVNARLPDDVRIIEIRKVSDGFVPLREAKARTYVYLISYGEENRVFLSGFAHFVKNPFSSEQLERFKQSLSMFKGIHDFSSFSKTDTGVKSRVREVFEVELISQGSVYAVRITGSGFLYGMVRSIVGACLECASGKIDPEQIERMLDEPSSGASLRMVPAYGLYLYQVWFKDKELNFCPRFPFFEIPLPEGL